MSDEHVRLSERRREVRVAGVPFEIELDDGTTEHLWAHDANSNCASFEVAEELLRRVRRGRFPLHDRIMSFEGPAEVEHREVDGGLALLRFGGSPSMASQKSDLEREFLVAEMASVWDRFKELEKKNKSNEQGLIKLIGFLLIYAAAPFSLQNLLNTGFARVWGLGGIWIGSAAWFYCDRIFRAYGKHLQERIFCLKQIDQLREIMAGSSPGYTQRSLMPARVNKDGRTGSPAHVSERQLMLMAYFYKIVSMFFPIYFMLFGAMILFGDQLAAREARALTLFGQTALGMSVVAFLWLLVSYDRCFDIVKSGFLARRVSRECPWPLYPREHDLGVPLATRTSAQERVLFWGMVVLSAANLVWLLLNVFHKAAFPGGGAAIVYTTLAGLSIVMFLAALIYAENRIVKSLRDARKVFPAP